MTVSQEENKINLQSLLDLLGGVIKPALRQALLEMPYPKKVGPPMAVREARVGELNKRINEINEKLRLLLKDAEDAGFAF